MGSASASISAEDLHRVDDLAQRLGKKLAAASCVLMTGELDGIPGRVVEVHRQHGGLSVGISPAHSAGEHAALYDTPPCPSTVVIYSGFGFKGRNVIGLLQGTGGAADCAQTLLDTLLVRPTGAVVLADPDPEPLIDRCIER